MPGCMHDYVNVCIYSCVCVCVGVCTCVFIRVAICIWLYVTAMQTCSCAPNPVTEDPDSIWIYVRYGPDTLDSKINSWDDPEIRTDSCSEDQTAIRFQTRVISGEC